jgi:hypothetical protein
VFPSATPTSGHHVNNPPPCQEPGRALRQPSPAPALSRRRQRPATALTLVPARTRIPASAPARVQPRRRRFHYSALDSGRSRPLAAVRLRPTTSSTLKSSLPCASTPPCELFVLIPSSWWLSSLTSSPRFLPVHAA